jgi:predicted nucleic acid-binding protein
MTSAIVVADTSVLINFLRIDRMDLIVQHPRRFLVTDHVEAEIAEAYPDQQARYAAAVAARQMDVCSVTDPDEVELFLRLRPGDKLGAGECSAIAVAMKRQYALAIDDNKAVKTAIREVGMVVEIIRTAISPRPMPSRAIGSRITASGSKPPRSANCLLAAA